MIVVDGKVTILNVLIQRYPLSTSVTYCLANRTLWKDFNRPVFRATANLFENGSAMLLT
jgi:hypothetical protein